MIVCNGIIISKSLTYNKSSFIYKDIKNSDAVIVDKPNILIKDSEGFFPIKLDRNDIDCDELPFESKLLEEVSNELIAKLLSINFDSKKIIKYNQFTQHHANIMYTKKGYSIDIDYFAEKLKKDYHLVRVITQGNEVPNSFLNFEDCFVLPNFRQTIMLSYQQPKVAPEFGGRILLHKNKYNDLFRSTVKRLDLWIKRSQNVEFENDDYVIYNFSEFSKPTIVFNDINIFDVETMKTIESVQELNFEYLNRKCDDILKNKLSKYIGDNVLIPYELDQRKLVFKKAFKDLARFMK